VCRLVPDGVLLEIAQIPDAILCVCVCVCVCEEREREKDYVLLGTVQIPDAILCVCVCVCVCVRERERNRLRSAWNSRDLGCNPAGVCLYVCV